MKVVAITGERKCEIIDRPEPTPAANFAKIKIESAPMCTEVKQYFGGQLTECLGHEAAGVIVEAGPQSRFCPGTRVIAMPLYGCGQCECCLAGDHILCANRIEPESGASTYAQYLLKPDHLLLAIPEEITTDHASMACCGLGPTFNAAGRLGITASDTVLIYGLGAVGLGGVINATARGARVIGVEPNDYRADLGKTLGADHVITAREPSEVVHTVMELTKGRGADKSIESSSLDFAPDALVKATKRRGAIASVGWGGPINARDLVAKGAYLPRLLALEPPASCPGHARADPPIHIQAEPVHHPHLPPRPRRGCLGPPIHRSLRKSHPAPLTRFSRRACRALSSGFFRKPPNPSCVQHCFCKEQPMKLSLALTSLICILLPQLASADSKPVVIHEWGTFTSLQDEQGNSLGAINTDDEPVPNFVHNIAGDLLIGDAKAQKTASESKFTKSFPRAHPDITMRLETPVLYVHTPPGSAPVALNVSVEFRGGWLTQFYPDAKYNRPQSTTAPITREVSGRLAWNNLRTASDEAKLPKTADHVWTTPRNVKGVANLVTPAGETEKYLFYRGIGHLDAPLRAVRHDQTLEFSTQFDSNMSMDKPPTFSHLWYCTILPDGRCAWRTVDPISPLDKTPATTSANFKDSDFSADRLADLRKDMHAALVSSGLFDDEATAMLDTWQLSYFKSAGTRIFYIVPPAWTESVLPLQVSPTPSEIRRVMIGRLDLVTPEHRAMLERMSSATDAKAQDAKLWETYDHLGRFRNALVLSELARTHSPVLKQFITTHGLQSAR